MLNRAHYDYELLVTEPEPEEGKDMPRVETWREHGLEWARHEDGRIQILDDDWGRQVALDVVGLVDACRSHRGQEIAIVDTVRFGRSLWVDGWLQFAMLDEHRYHQTLVLQRSTGTPTLKTY